MTRRYEQRRYQYPPDATQVLLVRHGASAEAVPGEPFELLEGHSDPPLAPAGEAQAQQTAERLAGEPLSALFTTTLRRTAQTAAPLADRLGLEPTPVPELREVRLGEWEGGVFRVRAQERDPEFVRLLAEERWSVIPGAEHEDEFAARVRLGFERVVAQAGPGTSVAAFVHGGVIAELCRQATASRPFAFLFAENCSISRIVAMADGRWLLRGYNDVAHLD